MHLSHSTDDPSAFLSTLSANLHMFWWLSCLQQVCHLIASPTNTSVVFCEWFSVCLFVCCCCRCFFWGGGATFLPFPHFNSDSIVICAPFSVFLFAGVFLSCSVFDLFRVTVLNSQPQESQLAETWPFQLSSNCFIVATKSPSEELLTPILWSNIFYWPHSFLF